MASHTINPFTYLNDIGVLQVAFETSDLANFPTVQLLVDQQLVVTLKRKEKKWQVVEPEKSKSKGPKRR